MNVVELQPRSPTIDDLLEAVKNEDVLLVRDGQPLARPEKFDQEDWQDWQYESSATALERGRRGREQYARGEGQSKGTQLVSSARFGRTEIVNVGLKLFE